MTDVDPAAAIEDALRAFITGAKTQHVGCYLANIDLERRGLREITAALEIIDGRSPNGRDVLLPLLDHPDDVVRVVAAGGLWQSHPEIAIPLLERIERYSITEAQGTAFAVLTTKGRHNPCVRDPRYPPFDEDPTNPANFRTREEYRDGILSTAAKH